MASKILTISIVIPVYNEEERLADCLEALAAQTVKPYEVIIVDNNSTDDTLGVASRFPNVRILTEKNQGVVYARDKGFNAARGDIIGRIDADTVVDDNWVETLQKIFEDEAADVVTGKIRYSDVAMAEVVNTIDLYIRRRFARVLGREVAAQGANMALRSSVWRDIRTGLCRRAGLHEDFDIAIHANKGGHNVKFDESLVASIGCRQAGASFLEFCSYVWLNPRTYSDHKLKSSRHIYPVAILVIACYPIIKILYNGYDMRTKTFSWRQALHAGDTTRVNPATFVD